MEYIGNILYDDKLYDGDNRFVIFGAGMYGRMLLEYMKQNGMKNTIICFCDSAVTVKGCDIEGIPVLHPSVAFKRYPYADYLVSGRYFREMYRILMWAGIEKIHIFTI